MKYTLEELRAIEEIFHEYVKENPENELYKSIEDKTIEFIVELIPEN